MFKNLFKKTVAVTMCGVVAITSAGVSQGSLKAADTDAGAKVDTSDWQKSITIDFGVTEANKDTVVDKTTGETVIVSDLALDSQLQLKKEFGADFEMAEQKECFGNMLYDNTTVQSVYGTEAATEQRMGFDRVLPAGKVDGSCGEYFRDWVFSPDGEEYSFSVDLPVGQYYVNVYTGNKIKGYNNTTCVQFNDESYMVDGQSEAVYYEQTSDGGRQFYIPNRDNSNKVEKVTSYIVDVKDNGKGYGTLKTTLFDNTDNEASHLVKASDVFTPSDDKNVGIKVVETYEGTEAAISKDAIADKLITARLNGIEIAPVENPVHAVKLDADAVDVEIADIRPIVVDMGAEGVTDRVFYRSSNPEVVEVDNYYGEVTAKGIGNAVIYAYNSYLDQVKAIPYNIVTRKTIELQADGAQNNELVLILGEDGKQKGTITARFNSAENDIAEWSVADSDIIKAGTPVFEKNGEEAVSVIPVEALKAGQTTITATRKDNNERTAQMTVKVINATKGVSFTDKDGKELKDDAVLEVEEGKSIEAGYVVAPEDATEKGVSAECDDSTIASVSVSGDKMIITGKMAGETTVKIYSRYSRDISDSVKVKVNAKPAAPSPSPSTTPAPSAAPSATPSATAVPASSPSGTDAQVTPSADSSKIVKLSGKSKITLARNKSVTLKITSKGTTVKKVSYKIKKGKKLVKVAATKKKVKITARKKGTARITVTVAAKGITKKFTRTIKIK